MHGPTFMAYPLGCAAANASLDVFEAEYGHGNTVPVQLKRVAAIEAQMREALQRCRNARGVLHVRVKGAVGVVQMDQPVDAAALRARFVEKGVWIKPFGDVIYLTPPLVIEPDDLSALTRAVEEVLLGR